MMACICLGKVGPPICMWDGTNEVASVKCAFRDKGRVLRCRSVSALKWVLSEDLAGGEKEKEEGPDPSSGCSSPDGYGEDGINTGPINVGQGLEAVVDYCLRAMGELLRKDQSWLKGVLLQDK